MNGACNCRIDDAALAEYNAGKNTTEGKVMSIIPIFIPHAGCPHHQCVFCNQKKISGQKTASAEAVRQQIEKYLQWIKPCEENEAAFYGGSFTGLDMDLQEELFKPVDKLLQEGIIGSVRLSTRPDYIDEKRLALLKKHNVSTVELGVQSLDNSVLELAGRGHNAASVVKAVELLRAHGFKTGLQLMCGMPGQTAASFMATVAESIALKPDAAESLRRLAWKPPQSFVQQLCRNLPVTALMLSASAYSRMTNCAAPEILWQALFIPLLAK